MDSDLILALVGVFIALFGGFIVANATFSDRAAFGVYVVLGGGALALLSLVAWLAGW